ncbi:thioredoxin family protein [Calditrichota bacterium]
MDIKSGSRSKTTGLISLVIIIIALGLIITIWYRAEPRGDSSLLASTPKTEEADTTANDLAQPLPTMLELGSEGCIPCENMKPIMAQLREEHGDLIRIEFHDVRKNGDIAKKYSIRLIPTQIFLKADSSEFFRHEGFFPKTEIEKVFRDMGVPL